MTYHGLGWAEALDLTVPQMVAILTGGKEETKTSDAEVDAWVRKVRRGSLR